MENENNVTVQKICAPAIINISAETWFNEYFRKEIWTGKHLQITVMNIPAGGEVGIELHDNLDQILAVEYGVASVYTGNSRQTINYLGRASQNTLIVIPAGTWHNVINERNIPLKLYSVYAPPKHPIGTIHKTKFDSDLADY